MPMSSIRINGLVKAISERPDPALLCLTVCPTEGASFSVSDLSSNKYEVIHGRHRLQALKLLDAKGLLTQVVGMDQKKIMCHIVRTDCMIQANYGALRGNELQAEFVRKPFLHELVYIMQGLREQYSKEKALETVLRFGKVLEFGVDDLCALKKLGVWPTESLAKLVNVFQKFEKFQTEDAKYLAGRKTTKIMKGQTVPVPHNLFRNVAKMTPEYMDVAEVKITDEKKSLKVVAEGFSKLSARKETMAVVVQQMSGSEYNSEQKVVDAYASKFSDEVLDQFAGSVIGMKGSNKKGEALKDYVKEVLANKDCSPKAVMMEIKEFKDVDLSKFSGFATIVVNCRKLEVVQVKQLLDMKSEHISTNVVLLFCDQDEKMEVFGQLESDIGNLREIFFETNQPNRKGDFCQNLKLGIVSAPIVYKPPLKSFNGPICNLETVINQITPPQGKSVFVNDGNLVITAIHSNVSCQYVGVKIALEQFDRKLRSGIGVLANDVIPVANVGGGGESGLQIEDKNMNVESKGKSTEDNNEESSKRKSADPAAEAILAVEPAANPVEVEQERYRHFMQLLHKCCAEKNQAQSLEIDVIRSFFAKVEKKKPFNNVSSL